jgi:hypothetical protein
MFDSVLPAESQPISVVSSRWLWAARCFALIYTISLVGEYVAAAHFDPLNPLVGFLFTFGLRSLLSLVLLYFLFRSGKKSLAFALGLGAATAFIALFGVASNALFSPLGRSFNLSLALIIFAPITPPFVDMIHQPNPQLATGGVVALLVLRYLFGGARIKQRRHIQENGARARSKGDGGPAIRLSRRNMLPTCRLADIHAAYLYLACRCRGHPHLNIPLNIFPR